MNILEHKKLPIITPQRSAIWYKHLVSEEYEEHQYTKENHQ
jgi:hypothetical protein